MSVDQTIVQTEIIEGSCVRVKVERVVLVRDMCTIDAECHSLQIQVIKTGRVTLLNLSVSTSQV